MWWRSIALLGGALLAVMAASEPVGAGSAESGLTQVVDVRTLTDNGGRLDWCHEDDVIAFDRVTGPRTSEVYLIRPDGSDERCLTCDLPVPAGFRGQPAWHPSCEYLVIQAPGRHSQGTFYEFVSWGIHQDLWFVAADGSWVQRAVEVEHLGGSLHPHFSDTGEQLFWAVRESTGRAIRQPLLPRYRTPGRENPWDGWHLAVADVRGGRDGLPSLANRREVFRGEGGFFESHALVNGWIYFTHTAGGRPFADEVYRARADGSERRRILESPGTWEEHAKPSPGLSLVAFMSSREFAWRHPPDTAGKLRTELWLMDLSGNMLRVTDYNRGLPSGRRAVASDFAWGPQGRSLASYVLYTGWGGDKQVIHIITLDPGPSGQRA